MDIKINTTYLVEIGSNKVHMSKFDMIKLRDKLNEILQDQPLVNPGTIPPFNPNEYTKPVDTRKWNFPQNPWYSVQD